MPRPQLRLDASSPSIIVPITARDLPGLEQSARTLAGAGPAGSGALDAVEWRVDLYEPFAAGGGSDPAPAVTGLERLAAALPDVPILATFRTTAEGGTAEIDPDSYVALISALSATGAAAAVDVEYRHPLAGPAIAAAHRHGTPVVASNHDFHATPPAAEIVDRLAAMEAAGADVAKIAVMPQSPADVVTLLEATERRYRDSDIPLITMSMDALGAVTRLGGGVFGSSATFATVGAASAPGQLPAAGVRSALDLLHRPD